jgi:hypothetical protein
VEWCVLVVPFVAFNSKCVHVLDVIGQAIISPWDVLGPAGIGEVRSVPA